MNKSSNFPSLVFLIALVAAAASFLPRASAQSQLQVVFSPDSLSLQVGESALVEVVLIGVPQSGLAAFQLELLYDPWSVAVWNPNEAFRGTVTPFAPLGGSPLCDQVRGTSSCPDPVWMLSSTGRAVVGADAEDTQAGSIRLAYATYGPQAPAVGDGTIALIEVSGSADGDYAIDASGIVLADGARPPGAYAVTTSPLWVSIAFPNQPPELSWIGDQFVDEGEFLSTLIFADDPDGNDVILEALALPPFCLFIDDGGGFGTLECSPGFTDAGSYSITVVATDDGSPSESDSETFTLHVAEVSFCNDQDGDGFGDPGDSSCPAGDAADCDDSDPQVNADATERCRSGVDDNCDSLTDGEDPACAAPICLLVAIDGGGLPVLTMASAAQCPVAGSVGQSFDIIWGELSALRDTGFEVALDNAQPVVCASAADVHPFDNLLPAAGAVDFFVASPAGQENYGNATSGQPRRPDVPVCP